MWYKKNRICDITKSRWFLILKHLFCDITKYVEFLIDKMMTPVFYLRCFFYIPADTKFRAWALTIFFFFFFWAIIIPKAKTILDITHSIYLYHKIIMIFDITKSIFDNKKINFFISQIRFCDRPLKKITMILWYQKIEVVMSQIRFFDTTKSIFDITKLI